MGKCSSYNTLDFKNVFYNDFNQLNWNLFKNVRGSNYKSFGDLLMLEDCQPYGNPNTPEELQKFTDTFNSYQKEIFAETNINLSADGIIEIINDLKKHIL